VKSTLSTLHSLHSLTVEATEVLVPVVESVVSARAVVLVLGLWMVEPKAMKPVADKFVASNWVSRSGVCSNPEAEEEMPRLREPQPQVEGELQPLAEAHNSHTGDRDTDRGSNRGDSRPARFQPQ
jgi:hypothetical protein